MHLPFFNHKQLMACHAGMGANHSPATSHHTRIHGLVCSTQLLHPVHWCTQHKPSSLLAPQLFVCTQRRAMQLTVGPISCWCQCKQPCVHSAMQRTRSLLWAPSAAATGANTRSISSNATHSPQLPPLQRCFSAACGPQLRPEPQQE
mmetsp:Transcript_36853/g.93041  ORF Transcript_36853/g.93041 Transcript_36853/m.93041 type:complete len:147 (+) Transcript_36853:76-516(+)